MESSTMLATNTSRTEDVQQASKEAVESNGFDFSAEFGPPKHALPDIVQRDMTEVDCDITEYVAPEITGFQAIVKHRYSDFNVFEITNDGDVVQLKNLNVPDNMSKEQPKVPSSFIKHSELEESDKKLISPLNWTRITHLAKKYQDPQKSSESDNVNMDVSGFTKNDRKRIHELIRQHFPHLASDTSSKDGDNNEKKTQLSVCFKNKNSRASNEWPKDRPKYLKFTLYKEDLDQHAVLSQIGKQIKGLVNKFTFAGTKDKRARTSQKVTVPYVTPELLKKSVKSSKIPDNKIGVGDFEYVNEPLSLGDLKGNRFCLVLRNISADDDTIIKAVKSLEERGFINYFGLQRFGTCSVKTSDIGLAIIQQNWQKVVELILMPRAGERMFLKKVREFWWKYRDPKVALKMLGHKNENLVEGRLLLGLKMCPSGDFVGSLNFIQRNVRLMYLHAYQSMVFNKVASRRIQQFGLKVLVGDLIIPKEIDPDLTICDDKEDANNSSIPSVKTVTEEMLSEASIYDVVLPLPGYKISYPSNEIRSMYEEILAEDGLTMCSFKNKVNDYSLGGHYRHVLGKAVDLSFKILRYNDPNKNLIISDLERVQGKPEIENEQDGEYKGMVVEFSLKSSQYATMAMREMLKIDTGRDNQTNLTQSHLEEHKNKREAKEIGDFEEVEVKRAKIVE